MLVPPPIPAQLSTQISGVDQYRYVAMHTRLPVSLLYGQQGIDHITVPLIKPTSDCGATP
ncbi:hypothetical protein TspCOW1_21700 [Thiohalobacter sp. COW1]|uniref:hypothetical protein n=1 Tax=Thiohalobacter sp. COW1 TaxID=2795687 RepID=UPI0019159FF8|nr:hypothetical protein [Thiohalobacter sp. COW1]BCO32067.1 hypothetical protein TspCOW1_21700 [Thiohalobacter sp. COW1]